MASEILIYDLKENKAFCLNETSALIYQLCDGKRTVGEISRSLNQKLNQSTNEDLIWLALHDFKKDNLLENCQDFEIDFNGLSRRQVIREIGFASLITLPFVASVIAPSAANAASAPPLLALCDGCGSPSECASGNCVTSRCSPAGNLAGFLGPIGGTCPDVSGFCLTASCQTGCCSGSTSFSPGSCVCNPAP